MSSFLGKVIISDVHIFKYEEMESKQNCSTNTLKFVSICAIVNSHF